MIWTRREKGDTLNNAIITETITALKTYLATMFATTGDDVQYMATRSMADKAVRALQRDDTTSAAGWVRNIGQHACFYGDDNPEQWESLAQQIIAAA